MNEPIFIGDDIKIVLTLIEPGRARVGIDAPEHLKIRRGDDDGYADRIKTEGKP